MMDGRFDHYFFEIFAESREQEGGFDATPILPPTFFALAAALAAGAVLALLA